MKEQSVNIDTSGLPPGVVIIGMHRNSMQAIVEVAKLAAAWASPEAFRTALEAADPEAIKAAMAASITVTGFANHFLTAEAQSQGFADGRDRSMEAALDDDDDGPIEPINGNETRGQNPESAEPEPPPR